MPDAGRVTDGDGSARYFTWRARTAAYTDDPSPAVILQVLNRSWSHATDR